MSMLIIGSRGSQLALWQSQWVAARLAELGVETRIEIIKTTGDKIAGVALAKVGGKGLFTKELEDALIERRIDLAVHSLKDLPTTLPKGLHLAAVPEREDPRDAVVGHRLSELSPGARVGTGSLRRTAQLRALYPSLVVESIRGNVDTRLRKLDEGQFDAIILASAGLRRLGWAGRIAEILDPAEMCPAVGQGALAIESRDEDDNVNAILSRLDHPPARLAVSAERELLAGLGGGCQVPIGAHASVADGRLRLRAVVAAPDGSDMVRCETEGPAEEAAELGRRTAEELLARGACRILEAVYGAA